MQIAARAARDQVARERILASAGVLAERFGLAPPPPVQGRDRLTVAMLEREVIAEFLEGLDTRTLPTALGMRRAIETEALDPPPDREVLREKLLAVKGIGAGKAEEILDLLEAAARQSEE